MGSYRLHEVVGNATVRRISRSAIFQPVNVPWQVPGGSKNLCHCLPNAFTMRLGSIEVGDKRVILIIIGIPSPTHSLTLGLNPSFSANPTYRSLSFFSFRIHYMDFPYCLLLLLSISGFLLFSFSVFTHF